MKKFILLVVLFAAVGLSSQAQLKFYYYPSSNVYYNVAEDRYVYLNEGRWTPVASLPASINIARTPRYVVYNQTPEVWIQNQDHVKKYKAPKYKQHPQGKAVGYKGSNINKASGKGNDKGNKNGKH
jgi:hypothetical protein